MNDREYKEDILRAVDDTIQQIKMPPLHPTLDKDEIVSILTRVKRYIEEEPERCDVSKDDILICLDEIEDVISSLKMELL